MNVLKVREVRFQVGGFFCGVSREILEM